MTYITDKDFLVQVQLGKVAGHSMVHKFGRNPSVPNGSWSFINLLSFTGWPLSAATTVRIKAGGNAADDAAGNGAREITVQGIDDSFNEVSETITTAGASASSATTTSFWRLHRAWVSAVGVYGSGNTSAITIENSAGGTDLIQLAVEDGQSQFAAWTVPAGMTAYLVKVDITVDAGKAADVRMFTRADMDVVVAPAASRRIKHYWDGVLGHLPYEPKGPESGLSAKTDIWFKAMGAGAGTEVSIDFELLLVND